MKKGDFPEQKTADVTGIPLYTVMLIVVSLLPACHEDHQTGEFNSNKPLDIE